MSKRFILICLFIFFSCFYVANAGVIINEVELYPTEERFIELYNTDNTEVDLTDYYIQRKTQTGTSFTSLVSKTNFANKKIEANGYFVISRNAFNNSDIVLGTLTLTESNTIQIKNGTGEVINVVCWGDVSDCTPSAQNPPEGQSISRNANNSWSVGTRSPGVANTSSDSSTPLPTSENLNSSDSTESTSSVASANDGGTSSLPKFEEKSITTKIKTKPVSFLNMPLIFEIKAYGKNGEELNSGKYFWNFGDGTTEERTDNKNFSHIYSYAGEYLVSVEYFANSYSSVPDVLNKIKIKVVPIELSISRTGDVSDFFIEITNISSYDIDISSWKLSSGDKTFTFPRNTNILAKKKIILSSVVTKFTIEDKNDLKLFTSDDKIVYQFTIQYEVVEKEIRNKDIENVDGGPVRSEDSQRPSTSNETVESLSASVINSDVVAGETSNPYFFPTILIVFLSLSGGAVYFLRRNNIISQNTEEFEILDE